MYYKSKHKTAEQIHDIILNSEKSYEKIEEMSFIYSNGDNVVREQIKSEILKRVELKMQSNPLQNFNANMLDDVLKEISDIHLNIVYKTHLFNNSVNPIEKSEILRQLNVLNHQIESKLITAHDYINVIKSNANITQTEILKIIEDLKRSGGNNFIDPDIFNKFIDKIK